MEKDVTLQLATEAGRLIEELLGVHVILTRTDDSDVPLDARAALANQAGGDLFISLHAGGSLGPRDGNFRPFTSTICRRGRPPNVSRRTSAISLGEGGPRRGAVAPPQAILWDQAQLDFLDTSQMLARLLIRICVRR